jgi:polo-like kinase 1
MPELNLLTKFRSLQDHTKVILCPLLGAVTYIDEQRMNRTFRFDLLEKFGCSGDIASRLGYAYDKVA